LKFFTVSKRLIHRCYFFCVEIWNIKSGKLFHSAEHELHIRYVLGVESGYIEVGEGFTVIEHPLHVCHLLGIQVGKSFNGRQLRASAKPLVASGGTCFGKWCLEHHLLDGRCFRNPSGSLYAFVQGKVVSVFFLCRAWRLVYLSLHQTRHTTLQLAPAYGYPIRADTSSPPLTVWRQVVWGVDDFS